MYHHLDEIITFLDMLEGTYSPSTSWYKVIHRDMSCLINDRTAREKGIKVKSVIGFSNKNIL